MKFEEIGETFYDGRVMNLDNASLETLNSTLNKIKDSKTELDKKLDNLIAEMQV